MTTEKQTSTKEHCISCYEPMYVKHERQVCNDCIRSIKEDLANSSVLQHLKLGLVCFFNFQFAAAFGCFNWAVERTFSIGDYNPKTGLWYTTGILKRKK